MTLIVHLQLLDDWSLIVVIYDSCKVDLFLTRIASQFDFQFQFNFCHTTKTSKLKFAGSDTFGSDRLAQGFPTFFAARTPLSGQSILSTPKKFWDIYCSIRDI